MNNITGARPTTPDLSLYRDLHDAMRSATQHLVIGIGALPHRDVERAGAIGAWFAGFAGELRAHHHVGDWQHCRLTPPNDSAPTRVPRCGSSGS